MSPLEERALVGAAQVQGRADAELGHLQIAVDEVDVVGVAADRDVVVDRVAAGDVVVATIQPSGFDEMLVRRNFFR